MQADDEREARIRALFPLVRKLARRIARLVPGADLGDLVGDGSVGLIRAVDNFDPTRGPSLEQYARHVVVGSMLNGLRRMDHVSERVRRAVRDGENERYRIAVERGEVPSTREMERVRPGYARALASVHAGVPLSLDAPLPEGSSIVADWTGDPAAIVGERLRTARLQAALSTLSARQQALVRAHYFGGRPLREISKEMHISPQRASQLHVAAVNRLRKSLGAAAR